MPPYTPKRVDVLLCGVHPRTHTPSYVLVELKQWTNAESAGDDLVRVPRCGSQPVLYVAEQVRRYCQQLVDFTPMPAHGHGGVHGLAYLHNAGAAGWKLSRYTIDECGQLCTRDERREFLDRLRALLDTDPTTAPDSGRADGALLDAYTEPSWQLLTHAAAEIQDREQFVLLDEQQVAHRIVEQAVARADRENTKTVVIVIGGPGSGKSVIALGLLGKLGRQGRTGLPATGSASITPTPSARSSSDYAAPASSRCSSTSTRSSTDRRKASMS